MCRVHRHLTKNMVSLVVIAYDCTLKLVSKFAADSNLFKVLGQFSVSVKEKF